MPWTATLPVSWPNHVGAVFGGAITSVTRFGLFVRLDDTGADGLVPMRALSDDWFDLDRSGTKLVGRFERRDFFAWR